MNREEIESHIQNTYGVFPDYPWDSSPYHAVYRHKENKKWFALVMKIPKQKMGILEEGTVDVMNVKCDPVLLGSFLSQPGFYPAYHMNKANWISVLLDGSAEENSMKMLLEMSFDLTL